MRSAAQAIRFYCANRQKCLVEMLYPRGPAHRAQPMACCGTARRHVRIFQLADRFLGFPFFPKETLSLSSSKMPIGQINFSDSLFLYACARHGGDSWIVEIGSYKGLSTASLALGAIHAGRGLVLACDPHFEGTLKDFQAALKFFQLERRVRPAIMTSEECASRWDKPVQLLWIDGDHSYEGVKKDVRLWRRFLIPGGIIALHDRTWPGPKTVFREEILSSPDFCEIGYLANIAYASYRFCANPGLFRRFRMLEKIRGTLSRWVHSGTL